MTKVTDTIKIHLRSREKIQCGVCTKLLIFVGHLSLIRNGRIWSPPSLRHHDSSGKIYSRHDNIIGARESQEKAVLMQLIGLVEDASSSTSKILLTREKKDDRPRSWPYFWIMARWKHQKIKAALFSYHTVDLFITVIPKVREGCNRLHYIMQLFRLAKNQRLIGQSHVGRIANTNRQTDRLVITYTSPKHIRSYDKCLESNTIYSGWKTVEKFILCAPKHLPI